MSDFTPFDPQGASRMVDVGEKPVTLRLARAAARVCMNAETLRRIQALDLAKGNVLEVARLAGIMAAKQTAALIPLCHVLPLEGVTIDFSPANESTLVIESCVRVHARTGVEMEALTAATVAALTVYDMCKSIDRQMTIERVELLEKLGGRSGHFVRGENRP